MFSALVIALIASAANTNANALGYFGRRATGCPTGAPTNLNVNSLPNSTEAGQSGYNNCGTTDSQTTMCQTAWINSIDDFCLWAPSAPNSTIGNTEREEVAWCTKPGHGARLIPDGTITGAHFVVTKDYVQITGVGDLTKINIATGDQGGELDPHGADGCGNPIGGIVFTNALGQQGQQIAEWTNFMAVDSFCFRACTGPNAAVQCNHIYDVMGCTWNMPGNYNAGSFDQCLGEDDAPMGVYNNGASTWYQGQSPTPSAGTAAPTSSCSTTSSIGNGFLLSTSAPISSAPPTMNATSSGASSTGSGSSSAATSSPSPSSSTSKSGAVALSASFGLVGAFAAAAAAAFF